MRQFVSLEISLQPVALATCLAQKGGLGAVDLGLVPGEAGLGWKGPLALVAGKGPFCEVDLLHVGRQFRPRVELPAANLQKIKRDYIIHYKNLYPIR